MYADRRNQLLGRMKDAVAIFPSTPIAIRNNDVEHEYRQDSDLFYLTGFDEPECVLVLAPSHPSHRVVLFVRPRDPAREQWDGDRAGVEGAIARFGADAAFPISEFDARLPEYLENTQRVYARLGRDRKFDDRFFAAMDRTRVRARLGVRTPTEFVDPAVLVHEMRLHKTEDEIACMRRAAEITKHAHLAAMQIAKPGAHEHEVEAEILRTFRRLGSQRPAYGPIVGAGVNATVLHYRRNNQPLRDGDLLLIDAGAELDYYACDVTRTFPVSGRFSKEQRALYDIVLDAQLQAIAATKPGVTLDDLHRVCVRVLSEGLVRLGLLRMNVAEAIETGAYKQFYMHRTSHWLGMDVHDVGTYFERGEPRAMAPGMVITIEPGLYVGANAEVEPAFRGIGIRIEDDILVTASGHEVLTDVPKHPADIEKILTARA